MCTLKLRYAQRTCRPWLMERWPMTLAVLVCFALHSPAAWAQAPYGQTATADPALQRLLAARSELCEAEHALVGLTQRLKAKLEASDEAWARLCRAARDTAAERDRTREAAIASVKATPEYVSAQESLARTDAKLQQLTDARDTLSREFVRLDDQAFAMRNRMHEIELLAIRDSIEMRAADTRAHEARQDLEAYWERYASEVLSRNPTWTQAVRRRDDAAQAAKQAETAFAAARRGTAASRVRSTGSYGSRQSSYRGSSRSSGSGHNSSRSSRGSYR